jgi:hypothetical protein
MARTPKRLAGPAQIATGPATIYTVPALTKTIIRSIHVQNPSGSPVTLTLSIGASAAATRLLDAYSIPAAAAGVTGSVLDYFTYYIMDVAEILQAAAGTNNVLVITVDGDELTLG